MGSGTIWRCFAVAIASFAIAAMASGESSSLTVARTQFDGGMPDMPDMPDLDAGAMPEPMEMETDAGLPGDLQGSLRGTPRSFAKTVPE